MEAINPARACSVPLESEHALASLYLAHVLVGEPASTSPEHALAQRGTACVVPIQDAAPNLIRRLGEPEQLAILGVDDAFVGEKFEVDGATPIRFADQHDRNRLDLARLHQGQDLEQLVHRAETARKGYQRLRAQQKVHLAQSKVVKAKTQLRRDVGIGILLVRQIDIQADGFCADL